MMKIWNWAIRVSTFCALVSAPAVAEGPCATGFARELCFAPEHLAGMPEIIFDGAGYKLYFVAVQDDGRGAIHLATGPDAENWTQHGPVLIGTPGSWDAVHVYKCSVIYDGAIYRMWYTGYNGCSNQIGLATSADGFNWTKHPGNPVLPNGTWDSRVLHVGTVAWNPAVGKYELWYTGGSSWFNPLQVGYATSSDGVSWLRSSAPLLVSGDVVEWHHNSVEVLALGGYYEMYYSGSDEDVRFATSADGVTWNVSGCEPVLALRPGEWDALHARDAAVLVDSGQRRLWYCGWTDEFGPAGIGHAYVAQHYPTRILLTPGGFLNGQTVDETHTQITLAPGTPLSGVVNLAVHNGHPAASVVPVAGTRTWGDREQVPWTVHPDAAPGDTLLTASIAAPGPVLPGIYYLVFAMGGEFNASQIMSSTWNGIAPTWGDGNDIGWDWKKGEFTSARLTGHTPVFVGYGDEVYIADDRGANWIKIRVPGQEQKLTAYDGAVGDVFGMSEAIDGNTIAVISYEDDNDRGSVYIFEKTDVGWICVFKFLNPDGEYLSAVALQGNVAAVGVSRAAPSAEGAVYILQRAEGGWSLHQRLEASDGMAGDQFGSRLALDGDTLVVGAHERGPRTGAAYVFRSVNGTWFEEARLTADDGLPGDTFGYPVAVSGGTIAIGAVQHDAAGDDAGAVYVFVYEGGQWIEQAKLMSSNAAPGDRFGESLAIEGDTILAAAHTHDLPGLPNAGVVYEFKRSGGVWTETAVLAACDARANAYFGSVSLRGSVAVIGAWGAPVNGLVHAGAAYVFVRAEDGAWHETCKLTAGDAEAGAMFGGTTATDGDRVVVGSPLDDAVAPDSGAAYVFVLDDTLRLLTGDVNCDGDVGFGDINAFVARLTSPSDWRSSYPGCPSDNADIDRDGTVDFGDINPFVALLTR